MRRYLINVAIAFDQLAGTLAGGYPDETMSAACWRKHDRSFLWWLAYRTVNQLFFWQPDHCREAYKSEVLRRHSPKEAS